MIVPIFSVANPVPEFPFVIVTESIDKRVKPDLVKIRFNLVSFDKSSEKSLANVKGAGSQLLSVMKKFQLPVSALESTQIDKKTKRARRDGAYNLEILGYETSQNFKLTLSQLEKYPELMADLVAMDGLEGVEAFFETTKEEQYQSELINELSQKARTKAESLASAQSRKIKNVFGITTEGSFGQAYAIFALEFEPSTHALAMDVSSYDMDLTMMVPEFIEVRQRITAIYELR